MKQTLISLFLFIILLTFPGKSFANMPDSVSLLAYPAYNNGLYLAWSTDNTQWYEIGPKHRFLGSDYGPWGAEKKMFDPFLMQGPDGIWHCVWSLNSYDNRLAHAASPDLINWKRQSYPPLMKDLKGENCLQPELFYDPKAQCYVISWLSNKGIEDTLVYFTTTTDFKDYAPARLTDRKIRLNKCIEIEGIGKGTVQTISQEKLDILINSYYKAAYLNQLYAERCENDAERFAGLKPVDAQLRIQAGESKTISDMLIGIFFEDINYAADGGLYAELIQNRDFEYTPTDTKGRNRNWDADYAWQIPSTGFSIDTAAPLHINNPHYAKLEIKENGDALSLINEGYDFIPLKAGEKYNLSLFAKMPKGKNASLQVRLIGKDNQIYGGTTLKVAGNQWKKYKAVLTANQEATDARLEIVYNNVGCIALDMISLFPQKTFKNRPNGLRADLAQTLADMHPRFVRFPGGCVAHGDGIDNIYHWENTIGPPEARKPQGNIWRYHQSYGLGYYEYFQFCEDIGAEPLPVLAAGVPCQNSNHGGQQGGIPMDEMDEYVEEVLHLIEWANGSPKSEWGKKRADAGHPKPFNLKYIGIGNEDLITDVFEERFTMIYQAVREKYPEIEVVGTVGPFYEGSDYEEGWDLADKLDIPIVDEHYYNSPGWFIYNQNYYDRYDRNKTTKVYLGEYASHLPGRPNNLETALSEALYLTAVERNADVVVMSSYAPLLAKDRHINWNPDLIYFNNTEIRPTVGYYVQQLYGQNSGDSYLNNRLQLSNNDFKVSHRVASSVVRDSHTGDIIIKLVNMLPVSVKTALQLEGLDNLQPLAEKTLLTGTPANRDLQPVKSKITVNKEFQEELPAYSFTVIRIKTTPVK